MISSINKYLLLFDIDGTLMRLSAGVAAPIFGRAIRQVLSKDIELHSAISFAGRTDCGILMEILAHNNHSMPLPKEKFIEIYDLIYQDFKNLLSSDTIQILPGVRELLDLLSNDERFVLGILTGNFENNAKLKLEFFNLQHYFQFGVYGDFTPDRIDLPLQALRIANDLFDNYKFSVSQCLVLGDTENDIESAKSAGMHSLAVSTGVLSDQQLAQFSPDLLFENFSDYQNVYNAILKLFNEK